MQHYWTGDIKTESQLVFDLSNSIETKCRLKIPKEIKLAISAQNGKLIFNKLINNIEVNLVNGKIGFSPIRVLIIVIICQLKRSN